MKRLILPIIAALCTFSSNAQELPQASPPGMAEQLVGLTHIKITYSRPAKRGRKIFGDLVPYGELWRTGANHCTIFECDDIVVIAGDTLMPGKYSLFTIPGPDGWGVMFNKNTDLWGKEKYMEDQVVLKTKAEVMPCEPHESFTISFDAVKDDQARVDFVWENTRASFTISCDCTHRALKYINAAVLDPGSHEDVFNNCASFLLDRNMRLPDALTYAQRSVDMVPHWYNYHTLAKAQAANGDVHAALTTAKKSLAMAIADKDDGGAKKVQADIDAWSPKPVHK